MTTKPQNLKKQVRRTPLYAYMKIWRIGYFCPYCLQDVVYETDGLPPKSECAKCLAKINFKVIKI